MPTFHLTTFGCQMNKHDSERIAGVLATLGFESTERDDEADLIILNSCSVRQSAEDRLYGLQEKYLEYKKRNPKLIVAVTGCLPGRDKKRVEKKRLPATDLYFPTTELGQLPRWISELRPDLVNSGSLEEDYLKIRPLRVPSAQASVTVQTGCNKYCSYCVVPYARGLEKNRPTQDILYECRELVGRGVKEITLLGQTVNSYKTSDPESFSKDNPFLVRHSREGGNPSSTGLDPRLRGGDGSNDFAALLWEMNGLEGLQRLYWTSAHPFSMTDEVIAALALPKQMNYLHLPIQSGSNEVLRRMNRKYTAEQFLDVTRRVKAARPGIALGTDIIVGFPGETREQFAETMALYREVDFDISYHAQYSPRSGTLAAKLYADDVSKEEKRSRWNQMQELMEETTLRKNQQYLGREVFVLVEKVENGFGHGNTSEMKCARFACQDASLVGSIVRMRVDQALTWVLQGTLV